MIVSIVLFTVFVFTILLYTAWCWICILQLVSYFEMSHSYLCYVVIVNLPYYVHHCMLNLSPPGCKLFWNVYSSFLPLFTVMFILLMMNLFPPACKSFQIISLHGYNYIVYLPVTWPLHCMMLLQHVSYSELSHYNYYFLMFTYPLLLNFFSK